MGCLVTWTANAILFLRCNLHQLKINSTYRATRPTILERLLLSRSYYMHLQCLQLFHPMKWPGSRHLEIQYVPRSSPPETEKLDSFGFALHFSRFKARLCFWLERFLDVSSNFHPWCIAVICLAMLVGDDDDDDDDDDDGKELGEYCYGLRLEVLSGIQIGERFEQLCLWEKTLGKRPLANDKFRLRIRIQFPKKGTSNSGCPSLQKRQHKWSTSFRKSHPKTTFPLQSTPLPISLLQRPSSKFQLSLAFHGVSGVPWSAAAKLMASQ